MTRDELIECLQSMPENAEVKIIQLASCCCGDCFLPTDGEIGADEVEFRQSITYKGRKNKSYILIT